MSICDYNGAVVPEVAKKIAGPTAQHTELIKEEAL